MNVISVVSVIKEKFAETGSPTQIPLQAGKTFQAELVKDGVKVSNLGDQPFLHWAVFQEAVCVLIQNGGSTKRGDAMRAKLGESELPLNSVEGHIAQVVYGKQAGDTVFRRIAPIAAILVWAGICDSAPGRLILRRQD